MLELKNAEAPPSPPWSMRQFKPVADVYLVVPLSCVPPMKVPAAIDPDVQPVYSVMPSEALRLTKLAPRLYVRYTPPSEPCHRWFSRSKTVACWSTWIQPAHPP